MKAGQRDWEISHAWETITSAFWCKYPNPFSTHVLTEDVIDRSVDEQGRLHTKRLLSKTNRKPAWMEWWLPDTTAWILEESVVDPRQRTMHITTQNITLGYFMLVREENCYRATDLGTTRLDSSAQVSSQVPIANMVEAFGIRRYSKNADKALKGLEWTLQNRSELLPAATTGGVRGPSGSEHTNIGAFGSSPMPQLLSPPPPSSLNTAAGLVDDMGAQLRTAVQATPVGLTLLTALDDLWLDVRSHFGNVISFIKDD